MKGKWWGVAGLVVVASVMLSVSSCGRSQELVSIQIQPTTETFGASNVPVSADAGSQVQLRALGSYIHPPVTKDITTQVIWTSNTPQMVTVDANGVITATGLACGGTIISATVKTNSSAGGISSSGAIVTGTMTANVVCFTGSASNGSPVLTLDFGGGSGTVSSNPPGLNCASTAGLCTASFSSGTTVTLTAIPVSPSTTSTWLNCDSANGNSCAVSLIANRTVTLTFS